MKKIIAGFVTVAFAASLVATPVAAQTQSVAELTAQINSLLATIASLQSQLSGMQGGTTTGSVSITMDLTMGSTGSQVVALQDFLVAKGHLVMPAGVAKGTFGALTRAAVIKYQIAKGITPAAGYVGPKTRAAMNAEGGVTTPGTGTPTTGTKSEGQLDNFDLVGSVSSEDLDEGEEDVEVLALEMDAEDSAMTIDRVDVEFIATAGTTTASDQLDDYVSEISVMLDGKVLATQDADEGDEDDDIYSFRFSGLKGVIAEGKTGRLSVAVTALDNIDDTGVTWTVTIPADGIRATDTMGISDTYDTGTSYDETFEIGEADAATLEVSESSDNPDAGDVEVAENSDTEDVEMLVFELEAEDQDVTIEEIPVTFVSTTAGVGELFGTAYLYNGNTLLASETAASTTVFEDLDLDIDEGDSVELTVKVDVNEQSGNYVEGASASVSVTTGNADAIDGEDAEGNSLSASTNSGSATGNTMTFRTTGVNVDLVSVSETADSDANPDRGTFAIKFKVTAFEETVYISATSSATLATGVTYTVTGATSTAATLTSAADKVSNTYRVDAGDTEEFTLTVIANGGGFTNVEMTGLKWGTVAASPTDNTTTVEDFETDPLYLGWS